MKFKVLLIAALLLSAGIAVPAKAEIPCSGNGNENLCLAQRRDRRYRNSDYYYYQINQIYREVLGREADSEGMRTYGRKLDNGTSIRDIREDIARSREARDTIKRMYQELTGRSPRDGTVRDYSNRLADGWTLSDVRADIVGSSDYRDRYDRDRYDRYPDRRQPRVQPPIAPPPSVRPSFPGRPTVPPVQTQPGGYPYPVVPPNVNPGMPPVPPPPPPR
jgi:hypothetical protein